MNDISTEQKETEKLQTLKKLAATVYLCQALTFMLAGLPCHLQAFRSHPPGSPPPPPLK
jgi:hypothetical protein